MALLYCPGELGNLLARGTTTCSPAAATDYPIAKASDGSPWPFTLGSLAADSYVQVRNNLITTNPGAEAGDTTGWTDASTGTGSFDVTLVDEGRGGAGTYGFRLNAGASGVAAGYVGEIQVRAGPPDFVTTRTRLRLDGWIKPGSSKTGSLRLYCVETGKWWVSGAWQSSPGNAVSVTNETSYTRVAETLVAMPSLLTALQPVLTVQVYMYTEENADVDFDDIALMVGVNGLGGVGHNLRPCVSPTLRYSDDGFSADDNEADAITLAHPTFYSYLSSPIYREWWRLKLGGTNTEAPSFDELWLGYLEALSVGQQDGWSVTRLPITEAQGDLSLPYRTRRATRRPRVIRLEFERWTENEWLEVLEEVDARTFGGFGPIALVPSTTSNEARFVYGRPDPGELTLTRESPVVWKLSLTVHEMAFSMPLQ